MKRVIIVFAAAALLVIGLGVAGVLAVRSAYEVEPALAGYGEVSDEEAAALAQRVLEGFNAHDATAFDEALDLPAMMRKAGETLRLTKGQRRDFAAGVAKGLAGAKQTMGRNIVQSFPPETHVKLLRTRVRDGQREALLRLRLGEGLNYFGLLLARDPAGRPRIVDWYNYMLGEAGHLSVRALMEANSRVQQAPRANGFERLVALADRLQRKPAKAAEEPADTNHALTRVREAAVSGRHAEGLELWRKLPEPVRKLRSAWQLRLMCAQGAGDAEYRVALDEMNAAFPGDPSIALMQIDGHFLRKEYRRALEGIDVLEAAVGGDPYLAVLRATALIELQESEQARAGLAKAIEDEPDLVDLWWASVTVALRAGEYGETMRLLQGIERDFDISFGDLKGLPEYAGFVASPEYEVWLTRGKAR